MAKSFLTHYLTKRNQARAFRLAKDSTSPSLRIKIFHFDFSENFTLEYKDAAQSTYWALNQVTLFTVALYVPGKKAKMLVYVSDSRDHTKRSICFYLSDLLRSHCDASDDVIFWSDGPASQFKNKFMLKYFKYMQMAKSKFSLNKIEWNFFATSYGKGAIDGVRAP